MHRIYREASKLHAKIPIPASEGLQFRGAGEQRQFLKRHLSSEFLVHSFTKIKHKINHCVTGNIRKGSESLILHLPEENGEKDPHY